MTVFIQRMGIFKGTPLNGAGKALFAEVYSINKVYLAKSVCFCRAKTDSLCNIKTDSTFTRFLTVDNRGFLGQSP